MKKITVLILAVIVAASFSACGWNQEPPQDPVDDAITTDEDNKGEEISADDALAELLVGTWEDTSEPVDETSYFVLSVVFEADGSCIFYGYENRMYGKYEVKDGQITLRFEWGEGEGSIYELSDEDNKGATYDDSTGLLTMHNESGPYTDIVWVFKKTV